MNPLRTVRTLVWVCVLALASALLSAVTLGHRGGMQVITGAQIGGPFTLTDQNGNTVTEAALQGHPSALFFGYTYCPDVCPTTLADLTGWMQQLGADADRLKVYFVTVDPERDTRETMASYLQAFDPRIVGLTGSRDQVDQILKDYRVFSRKVPGADGSYTMDHTATVYLLDKTAQFVATLDYQEKPDVALQKLKRLAGTS
jgi:protein SCO1/2